jgi:hypothetical protein
MKAITVQQPWAWAIVSGTKNVENRTNFGTWRPAQGTTIAIHAGMRWSDGGAARIPWHPDQQATAGAIVGTAYVHEVHYADGDCDPEVCAEWGENAYREHAGRDRTDIVHLVLEHRRALREVIPWRGALGLWNVGCITDADTTREPRALPEGLARHQPADPVRARRRTLRMRRPMRTARPHDRFDNRCRARHGTVAPISGTKIVLTTAHLDHTPENCADDNLMAMCQGCHLHYDRDHHAETARATRAAADRRDH